MKEYMYFNLEKGKYHLIIMTIKILVFSNYDWYGQSLLQGPPQ